MTAAIEPPIRGESSSIGQGTPEYDIRRPPDQGDVFKTRYWSPLNSPVLNDRGDVASIIHQVEDVSESVALREGVEHERIGAAHRRGASRQRSVPRGR